MCWYYSNMSNSTSYRHSLASCWQTKTRVTVKQATTTKDVVRVSTNCQTSP